MKTIHFFLFLFLCILIYLLFSDINSKNESFSEQTIPSCEGLLKTSDRCPNISDQDVYICYDNNTTPNKWGCKTGKPFGHCATQCIKN